VWHTLRKELIFKVQIQVCHTSVNTLNNIAMKLDFKNLCPLATLAAVLFLAALLRAKR
jgi:hypothetical protein